MFVRMDYIFDSMFKLNVRVKLKMNKINSFTYLLESSNFWHGRLKYANYDTLRRLIISNCMPTFHINSKHKCETFVEAKFTRSPFK